MIKLTVLYGHPTNVQEFETYYADTHLPIAAKMKGVDRLELTRFTPGPDGSQPAVLLTFSALSCVVGTRWCVACLCRFCSWEACLL